MSRAPLPVVFLASAILGSILLGPRILSAQQASFPWEGEVTGTNVYVRSGPGTDHYPCTKLHTGDRVLVLGEELGWYQIAPPPRSFSYVDSAHVQKLAGSKQGQVIAEQASIRAGSDLVSRKNAEQGKLARGARVEIMGEADGFFKIIPPPGALMYMSKQYISAVPPRLQTGLVERHLAASGPQSKGPATPQEAGRQTQPPDRIATAPPAAPIRTEAPVEEVDPFADEEAKLRPEEANGILVDDSPAATEPKQLVLTIPEEMPAENAAPASSAPPVRSEAAAAGPAVEPTGPLVATAEAQLSAVESDLDAEMSKPIAEQSLEPLIERYEEIAARAEERVPAEYAKIRIEQLGSLIEVRKTRTTLAEDGEDLAAFRTNLQSERMKILRLRQEKMLAKFDFEGELRQSYAFSPEKRRFRLVDPQTQTTIAYIDVPRDVVENVEHMIGRMVGIRVSGQRYSSSARVPIAVAASITDLTPRMSSRPGIMSDEDSNRPNAVRVESNTPGEAAKAAGARSETRIAAEHPDTPEP